MQINFSMSELHNSSNFAIQIIQRKPSHDKKISKKKTAKCFLDKYDLLFQRDKIRRNFLHYKSSPSIFFPLR